ncbi:MAG: hypothetical protein FWD55_00300 [Propionibacteriaceae bacterium]|nr:hypothetical protein [Propionibacteriaceae bacterium]
MTVVVVGAAVACALFLVPSPGPGLKRLEGAVHKRRNRTNPWVVAILICLGGVLAGVFSPPVAVMTALAMITTTVAWVMYSRRTQKRALARTVEVARAAQILESLVGLGHVPAVALSLTAEECSIIEPAVAALRMGGDPAAVLEELSRQEGQAGLARIGHALAVSHASGGSMHASLQQVRDSLDEAVQTAGLVASELAGPRATAQILALLPLFGLGIAYSLGTNPFTFLTGQLLGRICLLAGVGFGCAGVVWSEILTRTAEPSKRTQQSRGR